MILTIDTSVAVKWIVDEPGSEKASSYLPIAEGNVIQFRHVLLAPSLIALEVHNTIAKKQRRGEATFEQLAEAEYSLRHVGRLDPVDEELIENARFMSFVARQWHANAEGKPKPDLATTFNIYDCIYIAHAKRKNATLLTADQEQAQMAALFNIPVEFVSAE
ncbi:MAG: type II toxin-antitoxin system VapC family toxin [Methylobacterium sp.]|jgi:predicted nucleic acid-binding protein|nr:type II toxin-antitoxin system VapC family toxin [Methylobacterium sp.]MCA3604051.1 type II toxin-antitoxin system VapC family toxin [Methylobacterium sp.]MCA3611521.1 type II toxin-antitoxin system VapC family toxin [Methylobacterium sp.]MCA3616045.1 type II toxin-antitoxin system VapC family toxin [Methylobacterium sp.]MCA3625439.1 type II toxin-antitoxin system VapC family toxin [Methylobacterium sp.]